MPYVQRKVGSNGIYYHALYHQVTHWAAYIAMMATLGNIAVTLSGVHDRMAWIRFLGAWAAVGAAFVGAMYFMEGMKTYGAVVREALPDEYLDRIQKNPHGRTIWIGRSAAIVGLIGNSLLLWNVRP